MFSKRTLSPASQVLPLLAVALTAASASAHGFNRSEPNPKEPTGGVYQVPVGANPALQEKASLRQAAPTARALAALALASPSPASTPALVLSNPSVQLELDPFGSFGHATGGRDAMFDDGSRTAGTVFEYMAHVKGVGFLDSVALLRARDAAHARFDGPDVVAAYDAGPWHFALRSHLADCGSPHCAVLEQTWTVTNVSASAAPLVMTFYLDGDLFFSGAYDNDWGVLRGGQLYEFDSGSDPAAPSTFLGLSSDAPGAVRSTREVGEYNDQRRRILRGLALQERLIRANGAPADRDGDGVTDAGFDVSVASQHDMGLVAPGTSVTLSSRVQWGVGTVQDAGQPLVAHAGGDRVVECEGHDGTAVTLDGRASEPAAGITSYAWAVDGRPAATGALAGVVLTTGVHEVKLTIGDAEGRSASDTASIQVVDTVPPVVTVGPAQSLWPPDHRLVRVELPVSAVDVCSASTLLQVLGVTSDEPADALGDGATQGDVVFGSDGSVWLRRERAGNGDGRVYHVLGAAVDESGNSAPFDVEVDVPHDQAHAAHDSGASVTTRP